MTKKRRKPFAANYKTADWLRKMGWSVGATERVNTFSHTKHDLFGFIDMIAMKAGHPKMAIQATATRTPSGNASARVKKILAIPEAKLWLEGGSLLWVVCWKQDKKSRRWEPDIRDITIGMFED